MALATLRRELDRLKIAARSRGPNPRQTLAHLRADRASVLTMAGYDAEPTQARFLRSDAARELLVTTRQYGKSTTSAGLAVAEVLQTAGALVLLLSPTLRQSSELFVKAIGIYDRLACPVAEVRRTATTLELANGSRLVSLPGSAENVRGFSRPRLVIVDEAAFVRDELFAAVSPMLSRSRDGRLVLVTTPYGKRGFLYDQWANGGDFWRRTAIPASEVRSIPRDFLAAERRVLGERWYEQEYCCRFCDTLDAVFSAEAVEAALEAGVRPIFMGKEA